jgi:two-component system chemotaxis response regulator CheB
LWALSDGNLLRFRCRAGHAFSAESLLAEQSEALEEALWTALRALKERSALARRMAGRARARPAPVSGKL